MVRGDTGFDVYYVGWGRVGWLGLGWMGGCMEPRMDNLDLSIHMCGSGFGTFEGGLHFSWRLFRVPLAGEGGGVCVAVCRCRQRGVPLVLASLLHAFVVSVPGLRSVGRAGWFFSIAVRAGPKKEIKINLEFRPRRFGQVFFTAVV